MCSAGRSHDGKPASPESAQRDDGEPADPAQARERDRAVADGAAGRKAGTATAVVSPSTTRDDEAAEQPPDKPGPDKPAPDQAAPGKAAPDGAKATSGKPAGRVKRVSGTLWRFLRRITAPVWVRHVALLLIYTGSGIGATWPRFTYLATGKVPRTADTAAFVWGMWWIAHQVVHLGNPFFTTYMAAPVGTQLGFSTLMPLAR